MSTVTAPRQGGTRKQGRKETPEASDRLKAENSLGRKLVAPAIVLMLLVTAFPMARALYLSLFSYTLTAPDDREFVGLGNYLTALTDSLFWTTTLNTVMIMVVTVFVELVIGFAFAMVMHRVIFARGVIRTSILIPYGIITVVSGFAWQFAFSNTNGFVNSWLPFIGDDFNWFAQYETSIIAIMVSEIWKTTPFMSLLLLAGFTLVPQDVVDAARVDGASGIQRLRKIIIPLMKPAILVAVLFRTLDAFRIFDTIYVQTRGAQGTESVSILAYNTLITKLKTQKGIIIEHKVLPGANHFFQDKIDDLTKICATYLDKRLAREA